MTTLQNPFEFAASDAAADTAAASSPVLPPVGDVAATPIEPVDLGTDCIGEIFAGALKLQVLDADYLFELDPGNQKYRGMPKPRLHVARFMQELDEPPLFLRQAVRA